MIHFKQLEYWVDRGYIKANSDVMDVGTQHLLFATEERATYLVDRLAPPVSSRLSREHMVRELCKKSTTRQAFLYELLALMAVYYQSIDIFDGPFTVVHDLNHDATPAAWRGAFDIVLNVGTLEHVINQANAFKFVHDVLKVGGVWLEQSPAIGYVNHGYFQYHPQFYEDLAKANGYEIVEAWYSKAGAYQSIDTSYALIDLDKLDSPDERDKIAERVNEVPADQKSPAYNFNAVIRKMSDNPFRFPLESRTSCGVVATEVATRYER